MAQGEKIKVICRLRSLLESEQTKHEAAPWIVEPAAIGLSAYEGKKSLKSQGELRNLEHMRRDVAMVQMDRVFDGTATTQETYQELRHVVAGPTDGLSGAILAYGQTSSGKTFSMFGPDLQDFHMKLLNDQTDGAPSAKEMGVALWPEAQERKGVIHFALEDLFSQIKSEREKDSATEFLVRVSYVEVYMERVNDLLREIGPTSQNLPLKEDRERGFYVEGLKEKIVQSPDQVLSAVWKAEKRRRIAHTRYNEVSSRSHTLLTITVESARPNDNMADDTGDGEEVRTTRVGSLTLVDLAGNERLTEDRSYVAESSSINKSLFFLGEVISKLSVLGGKGPSDSDGFTRTAGSKQMQDLGEDAPRPGGVHIPYRDSKLTRLLQNNLGGNSMTAMLITLHPAVAFVEQSLQSLRFAAKAASVKTVLRPNYVSKEQSLIARQRELISDLRAQIRQYEEQKGTDLAGQKEALASVERLTVGQQQPSKVEYVSQSRELDVIVMTLHKSNEQLRKRMEMREQALLKLQQELRTTASNFADALQTGAVALPALEGASPEIAALRAHWEAAARARPGPGSWPPAFPAAAETGLSASPAARAEAASPASDESAALCASLRAENDKLREDLRKAMASSSETNLRGENVQLKKQIKMIAEERRSLEARVKQLGEEKEQLEASFQEEIDKCKVETMAQIANLRQEKSSLTSMMPRTPSGDSDFDLASALNGVDAFYEAKMGPADIDTWAARPAADASPLDVTPRQVRPQGTIDTPVSAPPAPAPQQSSRSSSGQGSVRGPGSAPAAAYSPPAPLGEVTLDFYRARDVKVDWKPGDRCKRLKDGRPFTVVRMVVDAYPPYVMLRGSDGVETAAELPLIAEFTPKPLLAEESWDPQPRMQPLMGSAPLALTPRGIAAATLRSVKPPAAANLSTVLTETGRALPVAKRLPRGDSPDVRVPESPAPAHLRPHPPKPTLR